MVDLAPIKASIARLEQPLNSLLERPQASPAPVDLAPVMAGLADLATRLSATETHAAEAAKEAAKAAGVPPPNMAPLVEGIARLEQPLAQLSERSQASVEPIDLAPVTAGLDAITSRLSAIEAHAASQQVTRHPDAGLVAEFDAARAPMQRLLVAFRLALREIAQQSDRLRTTVDGIARPDATPAPPLDLSPIAARLDDVVARLAALEAATQSFGGSRPTAMDVGRLAEFDAAKAPMQRILVGLRLALREISEDATQFRETVKRLGSQPAADAGTVATPPIDLSPIAEQLDDIVNRLSSVEAATQEAVRSRPMPADAGQLAEFDMVKAPMQRILVGLRLALRDISDGAAEFRETVKRIATQPVPDASIAATAVDLSPIAERLDDLARRFSALEISVQEAATPTTATTAPVDPQILPQLVLDRSAMSSALTGLKLMMRQIAGDATALREAADALPGKVEISAPAPDLSPLAERLDDLARRLSAIEAALLDANRAPPAAASNRIESDILPQLVIDRSAMSTALTGLKLMMREIAIEATALRQAADSLPGKVEVMAPAIDLSAITEPLTALREELSAGHSVLAEIHAQIGRDALATKEIQGRAGALATPSLATTLSLMSAFSSSVEIRFNDIEGRIADVAQRYQSGDMREAGDELVTRLFEAASEMRKEVDQFLAVGAALSSEIERAAKDRKPHPNDDQTVRAPMRLR
jgi:hypothetical protein